MQYGLGHLSISPVRLEPSDTSEMVTQLLYGEHIKVLEQRRKWSRIRIGYDKYEGWIDNKQYVSITEEDYQKISKEKPSYSTDLVEYIQDQKEQLIPITLGSSLVAVSFLEHQYDGNSCTGIQDKSNLLKTAFLYLNAPYLWGGKTPFGIDCSGFTQMVYKINGHELLRDASQQATQGVPLSFIEESEPGDLAFFDNAEGNIIHVGIIMQNNYIIHAHGSVRIDRLDHSGIYNVEKRTHTHKLRVIKKII